MQEYSVYYLINQLFSRSLGQQPWHPALSNGLFTSSANDYVLSRAQQGVMPNTPTGQLDTNPFNTAPSLKNFKRPFFILKY